MLVVLLKHGVSVSGRKESRSGKALGRRHHLLQGFPFKSERFPSREVPEYTRSTSVQASESQRARLFEL